MDPKAYNIKESMNYVSFINDVEFKKDCINIIETKDQYV
jgi:hypothetical protein